MYCASATCSNSHSAAGALERAGFSNVCHEPDIATTADKVLQTAYVAALKAALPDERDPQMRNAMECALKEAEQSAKP